MALTASWGRANDDCDRRRVCRRGAFGGVRMMCPDFNDELDQMVELGFDITDKAIAGFGEAENAG